MEPLYIGQRREPMWDDWLIDTEKTDTPLKLHHPVERECTVFEEPWAQGTSPYCCVMRDGDRYLMYTAHKAGTVCSVSSDGIHWERPDLGIVEFEGSKHNALIGIIGDGVTEYYPPDRYVPAFFDGFRMFADTNPACLPGERIKAMFSQHCSLHLLVSEDGFRFRYAGQFSIPAQNPGTPYDSVNTLFYDPRIGKYRAYVRDYFQASNPADPIWIRAISASESAELFPKSGKWPKAQYLQYDTPNAWQMYINSIMPYERADHILVGFPSRYVIRREWTANYDELCGSEERRKRAGEGLDHRLGLSVDDTLFMMSRDGYHFKRFPEAFLRPGPEHPRNWVYGSVYFSNGMFETAPHHPGCDNEISFYCLKNRFFPEPPEAWRYSIRLDGFVSRTGVYPEANLVTKPFVFEGKDLFVNFSTSAYGHMRFRLTDTDGNSIQSCETFGDSADRRVRFDGDVGNFAGRPVVLTVNMFDADLYSIMFRG
ncbi:MAG: hypothetical protein IIU08_11420 [Clostridia bacterium]|nr:hypothetical protein [Clostridia bacterium]